MRALRSWPVVVGIVGATLLVRYDAMEQYLSAQRYEHIYALPPDSWLRLVSLGHRESLADLIWIRGLIYVGDEVSNRGSFEHLNDYADAVLTLDPRFARAYLWASTLGLYRPSATLEEGRRAVAYLERAHDLFPDERDLVWELAAAYAYELPSLTDDLTQREVLRGIGADYMQRAAMLGAGPEGVVLSSATHLMMLGRTEQAVRHLEEMFAVVNDDDVREEIARRLETLRAESSATALRAADQELRERAERDYPWVPLDFHSVVGERQVARR